MRHLGYGNTTEGSLQVRRSIQKGLGATNNPAIPGAP